MKQYNPMNNKTSDTEYPSIIKVKSLMKWFDVCACMFFASHLRQNKFCSVKEICSLMTCVQIY